VFRARQAGGGLMAMADIDLNLEELLDDGPQGADLRNKMLSVVGAGAVDPEVGVRLAVLSVGSERPAFALGMLAAVLDSGAPAGIILESAIAQSLAALASTGTQPDPLVANFFRALDRLDSGRHDSLMDMLANIADDDLGTVRAAVRHFAEDAHIAASESFLGVALVVRQFDCDDAASREVAEALAGLPDIKRWTYRALAKIKAQQGDYAAAETLCRTAVNKFGLEHFVIEQIAGLCLAQGRMDDARMYLELSVRFINPEAVAGRRRDVEEWKKQFDRGVAEDLTDYPDKKNWLGAAVNYTDTTMVSDVLWPQHRWECPVDLTYRRVCAWTNTTMFGIVEEQLAADPEITKIVNYGTMCGVREAELASRHADRLWVGFDISETATALNRDAFRAPNLRFDSDLSELLRDLAAMPGKTLLTHCRSFDCVLPARARQIYRSCHEAGVDIVVNAEYFSRCQMTMDYPDFEGSDAAADAVYWDGILVIHNYAKVLPACGYRIVCDRHRPVPLLRAGHGVQDGMTTRLVIAVREPD
jgi:hypothetical protein